MKIKLGHLLPNPFRDYDHYPFDRAKVERLKDSIRTTGFWDNLIVRKIPVPKDERDIGGVYQSYEIAYGHHRLKALHELVSDQLIDLDFELELPVRHLDDACMVRIMAAENATAYGATPDLFAHTIKLVRDFIMAECKVKASEISADDIAAFLHGGIKEAEVKKALKKILTPDEEF